MFREYVKCTEDFIFCEDQPEQADVIFIPGNGWPHMAERAAVLYKQGYAPLILPSGRYSVTVGKFAGVQAKEETYNGNYETEWEFLRDVLIKNGVPEQAILREDQATYTYENALKSKEVTDRAKITVQKGILCCKAYHARRCKMYYQTVFRDTEFLVCPSVPDGITRQNWRTTENGITEVTGEVQRIIRQFSLLMPDDAAVWPDGK